MSWHQHSHRAQQVPPLQKISSKVAYLSNYSNELNPTEPVSDVRDFSSQFMLFISIIPVVLDGILTVRLHVLLIENESSHYPKYTFGHVTYTL